MRFVRGKQIEFIGGIINLYVEQQAEFVGGIINWIYRWNNKLNLYVD